MRQGCLMVLAVVALCCGLAAHTTQAAIGRFEYHQIARCGNKMGQTSLVDVDKDGDLDWVVGCRSGDIWWFEYQGPDKWVRHLIGSKAPTDVGGTAFDVDGDGFVDQVSGQAWYRNTGKPRSEQFIRYDNGAINCHDDVAADIDGDGRLDLVAMSDRNGLHWYSIGDDPTKPWTAHEIGPSVHGAIDPRGVADLDGDGDCDIVRTNAWFENADGKGLKWVQHSNIDFGRPQSQYPNMTKSWIADMDGDGDNDIIEAEGDCKDGRIAWFENVDGKGLKWKRTIVADNTNQDFHSLAVADFDNDRDLDIFSGGGPLTPGQRKWFIWENLDGKGGSWKQHEILADKRCHEAKAADVDNDGDIDIVTKPWDGDEHVYLRNMLMEDRAAGAGRRPQRR